MENLTILISFLTSIISAMVLFSLKRHFELRDKKDEEKYTEESNMNLLILKNISALGKLTEANAIAIRDGKNNGHLHSALEEYEKVDKELFEFLLRQKACNNNMR